MSTEIIKQSQIHINSVKPPALNSLIMQEVSCFKRRFLHESMHNVSIKVVVRFNLRRINPRNVSCFQNRYTFMSECPLNNIRLRSFHEGFFLRGLESFCKNNSSVRPHQRTAANHVTYSTRIIKKINNQLTITLTNAPLFHITLETAPHKPERVSNSCLEFISKRERENIDRVKCERLIWHTKLWIFLLKFTIKCPLYDRSYV